MITSNNRNNKNIY